MLKYMHYAPVPSTKKPHNLLIMRFFNFIGWLKGQLSMLGFQYSQKTYLYQISLQRYYCQMKCDQYFLKNASM